MRRIRDRRSGKPESSKRRCQRSKTTDPRRRRRN
jgi:hypothetical protein